MTWQDIYRACFGRNSLTASDAETWERIIMRRVKNVTSLEIEGAIEDLAEQDRQQKLPRYPTANDIISRIIKLRWQTNEQRFPPEVREQKSVEQLQNERKNRILNAESDEDAWDIVCEPDELIYNVELEKYAKKVRPGFQRPKFSFDIDRVITRTSRGLSS